MSAAVLPSTAHAPGAAWEPARQLTLVEARKRSRFLRVFRVVCIAISGGALASVFAFVVVHSLGASFGLQDQLSAGEALRMINPRFVGQDGAGANYTITAASAVRRSRTSDVVELDHPVFTGENERTISAPVGYYRDAVRSLQLTGGVVFQDKDGYRFTTAAAQIDAAADRVSGGAVRGSGPLGDVRADAYEIRAGGDRVLLRGNVRGVLKGSSE